MSVRMHVCSKHEIEYGSEGFANDSFGIFKLLKDKGCDIWTNDECQHTGNDWEIDAEQLHKAVKEIKEMPEEELKVYFDDENFKKENMVSQLEGFIKTGTTADGNYHFSWF